MYMYFIETIVEMIIFGFVELKYKICDLPRSSSNVCTC